MKRILLIAIKITENKYNNQSIRVIHALSVPSQKVHGRRKQCSLCNVDYVDKSFSKLIIKQDYPRDVRTLTP